MDEPSNALMGMHGYCTQELVNLIVTGAQAAGWHVPEAPGLPAVPRLCTGPCAQALCTLLAC